MDFNGFNIDGFATAAVCHNGQFPFVMVMTDWDEGM